MFRLSESLSGVDDSDGTRGRLSLPLSTAVFAKVTAALDPETVKEVLLTIKDLALSVGKDRIQISTSVWAFGVRVRECRIGCIKPP